jgi:hypothetical protein
MTALKMAPAMALAIPVAALLGTEMLKDGNTDR